MKLVGWPGAILIEGTRDDCKQFTREMKRLQWKYFVERGQVEATDNERKFVVGQIDEVESVKEFAEALRDRGLGDLVDIAFRKG